MGKILILLPKIINMRYTTKRQKLVAEAFTLLLPAAPYDQAEEIRQAALSPHMRNLPPPHAVWLAAIAHIRHQHTDYDHLRDDGYDKDSARYFVLDAINDKLTQWRSTRLLTSEDDDAIY